MKKTTQTPPIDNITGTQSLRDTLSFMKISKTIFTLVEKPNGNVLWIGIYIQLLGEISIQIEIKEYDIIPNIQIFFTNTKATTKNMEKKD